MRYKGTKYPPIEDLPREARTMSVYATEQATAVAYLYTKYERFLTDKGKDPGYTIRCFRGINFIIPN